MHDLIIAALLSLGLVAVSVVIHYEALIQLERMAGRLPRHRWAMLLTVHGLLFAHIIEICAFAGGYYLAQHLLELGTVVIAHDDWFDYVYYSAMVYTTVGFGDIVPTGGLRMTTSLEGLAGLSLITWSASFTFLQMQRIWQQ